MRFGRCWIAAALLLVGVAWGGARGASTGPTIERVDMRGNVRVEEDAVRVHLHSQAGQPFDQDVLDADLKAVYGMGFFSQVTTEMTPAAGGRVVVVFHLVERPLVRTVKIEGGDKVKKEDLEAALKIRAHTILDPEKAQQGIEAAKKLYQDKGYLDAAITYETPPVGDNEVDLIYTVKEGEPIRVKDIDFEGNSAYSDRTLRGILQTKERWFLSPLTGAGNLNRDVLRTDTERLTAWYYDHGYVMVRVDEPQVVREGDGLKVRIKVDEGEQFKIGKVDISGKDLPRDRAAIEKGLAVKPGEVFSASDLRNDVEKLNVRLSDDGYAFATVEPDTAVHPEDKTVDVTFQVDRGRPVMVERIEITGNTKTRDKVLRREMRLQEQELYSGTKLRKSRDALQRLGFFQEVNVSTRRAGGDDKMNVLVDVKEQQTGAFSAGAGFSSADSILFNASVRENNLFGRGQRLVLNADFGTIRRNILLSFTEPYFRDTPLTVSFDAFSWRLRFEDFDRGSTGFGTELSYPVTALGYDHIGRFSLEDVRLGTGYRFEKAKISNVGANATPSILAEEGTTTISSITPRIVRNTLNHAFDPTAGSYQDLSVQLAGLGGEQFTKFEATGRWYYTFWKPRWWGDLTYSLGANLGYGFGSSGLDENGRPNGDELPLFERYFPGGINSIRGFKSRSLGPREFIRDPITGRVRRFSPIGGSEQVILNNEIIFPIVQQIGLKGVVFVDAGNAYSALDGVTWDETRLSAGAGLRWLSPVGPLRVELGKPIRSKPHDQKSILLFSFGGPFQQ